MVPVRIFTTERPNAFKSFREMLKGFQTGVGENKTKHKYRNKLPAKLWWEYKENKKCQFIYWGQIILFLSGVSLLSTLLGKFKPMSAQHHIYCPPDICTYTFWPPFCYEQLSLLPFKDKFSTYSRSHSPFLLKDFAWTIFLYLFSISKLLSFLDLAH